MADIDKELRDIKNAVYGKEVRGSIHDGIKKINEESEESKAKADEAHDVMESIINEGFDNAALESNFEQKLDDKIANLQPEWTGFKEDITTQLAETTKYLGQISINVMFPPEDLSPAVGDGATNDTEAIQEIINYAISNGGGRVVIPYGHYFRIFGTLEILDANNIEITGGGTLICSAGERESEYLLDIRRTKNVDINNIKIDGSLNTNQPLYFRECESVFISNIDVKRLTQDNTSSRLMRIDLSNYVYIHSIVTEYGLLGINGCYFVRINDIHSDATGKGIDELIDFNSCRNIRIRDCYGKGFTEELIDAGAVTDMVISNVDAVDCYQGLEAKGEEARPGFEVGISDVTLINFNCYNCDRGHRFVSIVSGLSGQFLENIIIRDCEIEAKSDSGLTFTASTTYSTPLKNVVVDNVVLRGLNNNTSRAINITRANVSEFMYFRDLKVYGFGEGISVILNEQATISVIDCYFEDTVMRAMFLRPAKEADGANLNITVRGNVVKNVGGETKQEAPIRIGYYQRYTTGVMIKDNTVIDNRTEKAVCAFYTEGISLSHLKDNTVIGGIPLLMSTTTDISESGNIVEVDV